MDNETVIGPAGVDTATPEHRGDESIWQPYRTLKPEELAKELSEKSMFLDCFSLQHPARYCGWLMQQSSRTLKKVMLACEEREKLFRHIQNAVDDALTELDGINSSGRIDYGDYCSIHDAIEAILIPEDKEAGKEDGQ